MMASTAQPVRPARIGQAALWRRFQTAFYALLYIFCVHYAYVSYINPTFEYAHYIYLPPAASGLLATYLLAWLPVLFHRPSTDPAQAIAGLIYVLSYVPIQLTLLFSVELSYDLLVWIQLLLAGSMVAVFLFAKGRRQQPPVVAYRFRRLDWLIGGLSLVAVGMLLAANAQHMRFVSFADVYDLRFESSAIAQNPIIGYLISWLSYCFISYMYARGLIYRKWLHVAVGLTFSLLLYMATGAKAAILLLPVTLALNWLWKSGRDFLLRLLGAMILAIVVLILLLPDDGIGMWAKSIVLVRIIGTAGWTASKYLEHFGAEGFTYYSHIGPINALTQAYPFGEYSLGQMIGIAYSGSSDANFNASFWASDGFAALGPAGIVVVTPFIVLVLQLINRSTARLHAKFAVLWMGGFFMALLNVPMSTALLSGGGLIIFLLAWTLTRKRRRRTPGVSNHAGTTLPDAS